MKNYIRNFAIIFQILLLGNFAVGQVNSQGIDFFKLDKYIEKSAQAWKIPGLAVAVVSGDSIVFAKGYGVRNINNKEKVDSKTLFAVASNTKSFTSAALSILVKEGKINWNDKVRKYIPYFELYDPYVSNNMTIRDLLCHRSGLETFSGDLLWYETNYTRKEVIERAKFLKPVYGFREHFGYSNIMFLTAGEIIPAVTDTSWDDFVKTHFFVPLEMKKTKLTIDEVLKSDNYAQPHIVTPDGKAIPINYMKWDNVAPAAAINSNVEEMSNWLIMQMNDGKFKGKTILDADMIWEMHSTQTPDASSRISASYFPGKHFDSYGLGWDLFDYNGQIVVNHGGGADGMISQTMFLPDKNIGLVVLTNSINYFPTALMYYVLDDYFGEPTKDWSAFYMSFFERNKKAEIESEKNDELRRNKNSKPSLDFKEYTGTYGGDLYGNAEVILENGKLVVKFIPTPVFVGDLTHFEYDIFKIKLRNSPTLPAGKVNFIMDENGKIIEMKINIPNPDFDFTELEFKKK